MPAEGTARTATSSVSHQNIPLQPEPHILEPPIIDPHIVKPKAPTNIIHYLQYVDKCHPINAYQAV